MKRSILAQFNKSILVSIMMLTAIIISLYVFIADKAISEMNQEVLTMQANEVRWILEDMMDGGAEELRIISENSLLKDWMADERSQMPDIERYRPFLNNLEFDYFFIASDINHSYYYTERNDGEFGEFQFLDDFQESVSKEDWFQNILRNNIENPVQFNIDMDKDDMELMSWINCTVFEENEPMGGIGVCINYDDVIAQVLDFRLKQVKAFIVDQGGFIQIAKNSDLVQNNSFDKIENRETLGDIVGNDSVDLIISTFFRKSDLKTRFVLIDDDKYESLTLVKIPKINWAVVLLNEGGNILSLDQILVVGLLSLIGVILIGLIFTWLFRTRIIIPLEEIINHLRSYKKTGMIIDMDETGNEIDRLVEVIYDLEYSHQEANQVMAQKISEKEEEVHSLYSTIKNNERNLRRFLDNLPIGVIRLDANMVLVYANQAALHIFGVNSMKDYREIRIKDPIYPFESRTAFMKFFGDIETYENLVDYKLELRLKSRNTVQVLINLYSVDVDDVTYYEGIMKDITKDMIYERELIKRANYDNLTGVLSRTAFIQKLEDKLFLPLNNDRMLYFLAIDFDCFKEVNDTYGHLVGDKVLMRISELLMANLGKVGFVGRIGGDEFAAFIEIDEAESFERLIRELLHKVAGTSIGYRQYYIKVTISIGATIISKSDEFESIYYRSDQALYRAKELGKNMFILYEDMEKGVK